MVDAVSATQPASDDTVLRLTRRFKAPREKVFRAFTEVDLLKQWWGPKGFTLPKAEIDLRPGGRFHFEMLSGEGNTYNLTGTYREIRPVERLAYSWTWDHGEMAGLETLVTIDFRDLGGTTEIEVTHSGLPNAGQRDGHRGGWSSSLDCLGELLARG